MNLGYDGRLFMLAFDHRGSYVKRFGIEGNPTPEEIERLNDGKQSSRASRRRSTAAPTPRSPASWSTSSSGPRRGSPSRPRGEGSRSRCRWKRAGQDQFDFEYGDEFSDHIERLDPDVSKVLVRYNPDGDAEMNRRQSQRLRRLSEWLHERDRKLLFELLVPAERAQLVAVNGDTDRYDAELRPELMLRAIAELQDARVEPDIWKIEGVNERADCERLAAQCRAGGRDGVVCVVLGRGADTAKVDHWLRQGAPVEGYVGFAIGRSIWGDPLKAFIGGDLSRVDAATQIGDNYLRFTEVYTGAEAAVG